MPRKRTTRREKGDGHYYYDKKTKQHQWTVEHGRKRYRIKDRDPEKARLRFEELKRQLRSGVNISGARTPLKEYLPHYIDTEVAARVKRSTVHDNHKRADLYILPTLGAYAIGDIKRQMVIVWVNAMTNEPNESGVYWARNSISQALGLLRRALDAAIPEYLEYNPAAGVRVPQRRQGDEYKIDAVPPKAKVFTPAQMDIFLAEVKRTDRLHGLYVYYVLLSELGPRRGEGLGLRRKDIDFETKTIRIAQQVIRQDNEIFITTPKTDAGVRELPVSDETTTLLREQCLRAGAMRPDDLVFPGKDGRRRRPDSVTQHFSRTCKRLGFQGHTLHSLRKYAITDWRTEGVDLEVAAALAGHKGIKTTAEVYSQPTMERKRAAVGKKRRG